MSRRSAPEVNAGSMADIAFLLLIFFLITTTMNLPQVHEERLPQKSDVEFLLNERNVLQIMANTNDKIGIEGEFADITDIQNRLKYIVIGALAAFAATTSGGIEFIKTLM